MPDVVLTGLPRSGTTLTCHLLNRCAETVALNEPILLAPLTRKHGAGALPEQIGRFFTSARYSLLTTRRAPSKLVEGRVPDNNFGAAAGGRGALRPSLTARGEASFDGRELGADFVLAVKHVSGFSALLERLVPLYPCYALIRNPLAVLASWNSVDMPVQQGFAPVAELIDKSLHAELRQIDDRIERQFHLLEWYFERFARHLPEHAILRYEEVISSCGGSLAVVTPGAAALAEPLTSQNKSAAYDDARTLELGEKLLKRDGVFWDYYSRRSVEEMLAPLRAGANA